MEIKAKDIVEWESLEDAKESLSLEMALFVSKRERRLWIWVLLAWLAIFASLWLGRPISEFFRNRGIRGDTFVFAFGLMVLAGLLWIIPQQGGISGVGMFLGVMSVYLLLIVRIETPEERTHLIEYGVLGLLIFEAFQERKKHKTDTLSPLLLALVLSISLGILDECIQFFLPHRVFDYRDIVFNASASLFAIGSAFLYSRLVQRVRKGKDEINDNKE